MALAVLLDTSVLRAALVSASGASRALLYVVLDGKVEAVASTALMLQYEDVLLRPETLTAARLSARDVLDVLDGLCAILRPVAIDISWRPQSPDSGDDLVIDAAVNGLAAVIATFNLKDLREPASRFGIVAETPAEMLRRLP